MVRDIAIRLKLVLAALAVALASPVMAQTVIEELAEVRFGNHGGTGNVRQVLAGPDDRTIVVGTAYLDDPKRAGQILTTLTYAEISQNGTLLADKRFGLTPAMSVRAAAYGNGVTYIYGFNAPSLFSDNPDTWVAAIAQGGRMLWRKPVDESKLGDIELFVEASGRLVMAGNVTRTEEVGIVPWSADGIMGTPQIFGTVAKDGWSYPQRLVRDGGAVGTELLYLRFSDEEVRLDRFTADAGANWTARVPWADERHPSTKRPHGMAIKALDGGALVLTGQHGSLNIDKASKRYQPKDLRYWLIGVKTQGTPSLAHIDSEIDRRLIDIDQRPDGSYIIHSNATDLKKITTSTHRSGVAGYSQVMKIGDGHPDTIKIGSYYPALQAVDTSDTSAPVMFGQLIDTEMGKSSGFAYVLTNYVMYGTVKTYAQKFLGAFEDIKHSRRATNGDLLLVSEAGNNSTLYGPVFRTLRITPGVKN